MKRRIEPITLGIEEASISAAIQQLHDLEVQGAIGWPVEGKIIVRIGCPLDDKFDAEALVTSFAEAEAWFREAATRARQIQPIPALPREGAERSSVVDELLRAGVPVTELWIYDGMFQATFADPEDTSADRNWIVAGSWVELEKEMRLAARRRFPKLMKGKSRPARPSRWFSIVQETSLAGYRDQGCRSAPSMLRVAAGGDCPCPSSLMPAAQH